MGKDSCCGIAMMQPVSGCDHGWPLSRMFIPSPGSRTRISGAPGLEGDCRIMRKPYQIILPILLGCFVPAVATAQSFRVQCPTSTITHPSRRVGDGAGRTLHPE